MRTILLSALLVLALSACNMTTARQSDVQTLVTDVPTASAQAPATTQAQVPTQAPVIVATTIPVQQNAARSCTPVTDWPTYTVVAGDTLGQIAQRTNTTTEALTTANCLQDANALNVGQTLLVPRLPAVTNTNTTTTNTNALRIVGDFAGAPDLQSCWASNPGTSPVVYDAINGKPMAVLSNRVPVVAANTTEWVQVYLNGTMTFPESKGWMRTADVSLIGACTAVTGVDLDSYQGMYIGNPAGVPDGLCVVVIPTPESIVPVYTDPGGRQIGSLGGWALWVSTQGSYYQIQFNGPNSGGSPSIYYGWVEAALADRVNC